MWTQWRRLGALVCCVVVGVATVGLVASYRDKVATEKQKYSEEEEDDDDERDFCAPMTSEQSSNALPKVWIYWGSQTGTAEHFAGELAKLLEEKRRFSAESCDLEEFSSERFVKHRLVVFIVATYGEGEPTDNAKEFVRWLSSKKREAGLLSGMSVAVCGLGNSQYPMFNAISRLIDRHLQRLGATHICETGECDDDGDIDDDFSKWKRKLLEGLGNVTRDIRARSSTGCGNWQTRMRAPFDVVSASTDHEAVRLAAKTAQDILGPHAPAWPPPQHDLRGIDTLSKFYFASEWVPLFESYEARQRPNKALGQTTKHIEFDLSQSSATYQAGDTLDVLPPNPRDVVEWFARRLELRVTPVEEGNAPLIDDYMEFVPHHPWEQQRRADPTKRPFPTPITIREALTYYCQLTRVPTKSVLLDLVVFCLDSGEKKTVKHLCSEAMAPTFNKCIRDTHMSLQVFIDLFMTTAVFHWGGFLQLIARQRPRAYSICSSPLDDKNRVAAVVSQLSYEVPNVADSVRELTRAGVRLRGSIGFSIVPDKPRFFGLCSSFLCDAHVERRPPSASTSVSAGSAVRVAVRASSLRLPEDRSIPLVMVATGTGIAPFRAFLREFIHKPRDAPILFFGCASSEHDWIYKTEMLDAIKSDKQNEKPRLRNLFCAFSRERPDVKEYVQHRMIEQRELLADALFERKGVMMVCGYTKMGREVFHTVQLVADFYLRRKRGQSAEQIDALAPKCSSGAERQWALLPEALTLANSLRNTKRYMEELWE